MFSSDVSFQEMVSACLRIFFIIVQLNYYVELKDFFYCWNRIIDDVAFRMSVK